MRKSLSFMTLQSLTGASENIKSSIKDGWAVSFDLIKYIVDYPIVGGVAIYVLARLLFTIVSAVEAKQRRDGGTLQDKVFEGIIELVVLVIILAYGSIAWGILE